MNKKLDKSKTPKFKKRTTQQKAATRKLTSRIVVGVLATALIVSIIFIFVTTNFMGSDSVVTETVYKTTVYDSISTTGFVIRDEEYIKNSSDGVLVYQVSNGEKVTADGVIANIYSSEADAVNFQRICDIEEEISELESLNNVLSSANVGLDSVNNRLDQKLTSFIDTVNKRDFKAISSVESDLLSAIYRKQIITGDQKNFDDKIAELEAEKESLENSSNDSTGEIKTENSGYFVSSIDGFEKAFSVEELDQISCSDLDKVKADSVNPDNFVGKIVKGVNWYLACPVSNEQAVAITHSNSAISVKIPYATSASIPARVVCVNQFSDEDKAVAIIECNYMSPALSQIRNEAVEIQLNTYEGLKVDKVALHDDYIIKTVTDENGKETTQESKVQGVYVKYGNQIIFKQVYIIYSDEDYIICSDDPSNDVLVNGTTIELYDEVVIEGENLYDGKLID